MFEIFPARERNSVRRAVSARCEAVADRGFRWLGRTLRETGILVSVGDGKFKWQA